MDEVTLKMNVEQAHAIVSLLDLAVRINMCQFGEFEQWARMGIIKHRDGRELSYGELETLDGTLRYVSSIFGFPSNANFGIGSPHVSDTAKRGYEIKKVLDKALAVHREPNPKGLRGVNYDGLIVRYTNDPAPTATITGADKNGPEPAQSEDVNHAVPSKERSSDGNLPDTMGRPNRVAES